ncbi:hypothetical protein ACVT98_26840 (plasmid) [Vibrio campbellii]
MCQTLQSYAEIISQECLTLTTQKKGPSSVILRPQKGHQHGGLGPSRGNEGKKAKGTQHRQYDRVAWLTLAQKRYFASSAE